MADLVHVHWKRIFGSSPGVCNIGDKVNQPKYAEKGVYEWKVWVTLMLCGSEDVFVVPLLARWLTRQETCAREACKNT